MKKYTKFLETLKNLSSSFEYKFNSDYELIELKYKGNIFCSLDLDCDDEQEIRLFRLEHRSMLIEDLQIIGETHSVKPRIYLVDGFDFIIDKTSNKISVNAILDLGFGLSQQKFIEFVNQLKVSPGIFNIKDDSKDYVIISFETKLHKYLHNLIDEVDGRVQKILLDNKQKNSKLYYKSQINRRFSKDIEGYKSRLSNLSSDWKYKIDKKNNISFSFQGTRLPSIYNYEEDFEDGFILPIGDIKLKDIKIIGSHYVFPVSGLERQIFYDLEKDKLYAYDEFMTDGFGDCNKTYWVHTEFLEVLKKRKNVKVIGSGMHKDNEKLLVKPIIYLKVDTTNCANVYDLVNEIEDINDEYFDCVESYHKSTKAKKL
ncbi:MAG: hypothetical protein H6609_17810, partial [Ignavibacteriales bacterium]|nr:hypothetical protein [Ignavibacteriales bacterium]